MVPTNFMQFADEVVYWNFLKNRFVKLKYSATLDFHLQKCG